MFEVPKLEFSIDEHVVKPASGYLSIHLGRLGAFLFSFELLRPLGSAHLLEQEKNEKCEEDVDNFVTENP